MRGETTIKVVYWCVLHDDANAFSEIQNDLSSRAADYGMHCAIVFRVWYTIVNLGVFPDTEINFL